jgi:hypothetical protein
MGRDGDPSVWGSSGGPGRVMLPVPTDRQAPEATPGWTDGRLGQCFYPDRAIGAP